MAEQHHELAHVFTDSSRQVTMPEAAHPAILTHRGPFRVIPRRNGQNKPLHYVSRFASPTV